VLTRSAPTARLLQACLRLSRGFSRKILNQVFIASLALLLSAQHRLGAAEQDAIDASLNEHVIYVTGDSTRRAMLQVTTFYPDGDGPFPLAVINHSKAIGEPKNEPRYRSIFLSRYFLSRGYAVALPMMRGFAGSGGVFHINKCDLEGFGLAEAADIATVIKHMTNQPHIDGNRIVVIGVGLGGWNTLALGVHGSAGAKGLITFSAGVREPGCDRWEENLITAAGDYGARSRLPSLWFCGEDDDVVTAPTRRVMYQRYTEAGGQAEFISYDHFKWADHNIIGSQEGYSIWIPKVDAFLTELGLPGKEIAARYLPAPFPPATNYAALDDVDAIPNATDKTKQAYREFLTKPFPRVFVITPNGGCGSFDGGVDPLTRALEAFRSRGAEGRVYAVDDRVVWVAPMRTPPATQFTSIDNVDAIPYLNATGRKGYQFFLTLPKPRAFVIAPDGGWAFSSKGFDPLAKALQICGRSHQNCRPYAVDDHVVWTEDRPANKQ